MTAAKHSGDPKPQSPSDQQHQGIAAMLRAHAQRQPHAIALLAPDRAGATYQDLVGLIDSVGAALRAMGLRPGDRIAIVLPNGPEMAAAFVAVAAAACCAPLNPGYRDSEFEFYLTDLQAQALIVAKGSDSPAVAVARRLGVAIIELHQAADARAGLFTLHGKAAAGASAAPSRHALPNCALLLHTSGTTSRPKLVPLSEANLMASASNIAATLSLTAADRCLNVMPLFHIHGLIAATLASLSVGASVVCSAGFDAKVFFSCLRECEPTWYTAVPTIHQSILYAARQQAAAVKGLALRFIRSSSAALPLPVMSELEACFGVPVLEAYGMTEASHQMTSNPLPPQPRKPGSVGRAVGLEVAVMNSSGQPLAANERGEVVIRGANVTAGYEASAEINQQAFFADWFRTGDEGYLDPEGYLFLTGRLKEMINRAGEKIAPREVDDVLARHPAVAQAVTFAAPDALLGEVPAAAVVLREGKTATESELRAFVATLLVDYKVPTRVMIVADIPKGPTGKLQRIGLAKALGLDAAPAPTAAGPSPYRAPRNAVQESIAAIWQEVLGGDRFGVYDNFFELGGQSLALMQIASRIEQTLALSIPMAQLYEAPTIAEMSAMVMMGQLVQSQNPGDHAAEPKLERVARLDLMPLSYAQERLWFMAQLDPTSAFYNLASAVVLKGEVDEDALTKAFDALVARHESLRTTFTAVEGRPLQRIHAPRQGLAQVQDLAGWDEAAVLKQVQRESMLPFDLERGPLLRMKLFRRSPRERLMLVTMHHIISDGWSQGVYSRELRSLYEALQRGEAPTLAELPVQYPDFAVWQRTALSAQRLQRDAAFWRSLLQGAPAQLNLPTDRARPAHQSHRGAVLWWNLDQPLVASLHKLARDQEATLFMVMLASYGVLLGRHAGQPDVVVGTPIANRTRPELEGMIGFFANTLALRIDFADDPSFSQLLTRIKQMTLDAAQHQSLPFEKLVETLNPERDLSRSPIFQTMFVLQPPQRGRLEMGGIELQPLQLARDGARFDLTVSLTETAKGAQAEVEYNTDLFDLATVESLVERWQVLLEAAASTPDTPVQQLPLLSPAERQRLIVDFNQRGADSSMSVVLPGETQALRATHAYVLDAHFNLAPIGVVGDLYLGGLDTAKDSGRANRRPLVANPFGAPGELMLRTDLLAKRLSNGQLEQVARPAPPTAKASVAPAGNTAPRTEHEEVVAAIWRKVLQLDQIGVQDNFFALGGHSLLATKVVTLLQDAFDLDIPVVAMFEAPTLEALAARMQAMQKGG